MLLMLHNCRVSGPNCVGLVFEVLTCFCWVKFWLWEYYGNNDLHGKEIQTLDFIRLCYWYILIYSPCWSQFSMVVVASSPVVLVKMLQRCYMNIFFQTIPPIRRNLLKIFHADRKRFNKHIHIQGDLVEDGAQMRKMQAENANGKRGERGERGETVFSIWECLNCFGHQLLGLVVINTKSLSSICWILRCIQRK